jgi:hypothetical protein
MASIAEDGDDAQVSALTPVRALLIMYENIR